MSYRPLPIKEIAKLERKRFRDEHGVFLIEGKKVIAEALAAQLEIVQILVTGKFLKDQRDFFTDNNLNHHELTVIADHNASRHSGTTTPQGIFAIVQKPEVKFEDLLQLNEVAVFENVRDPGNLGTMLRTADWFGVQAIIVSNEGVDPYNDKVIRATMGSLFHLKIYSSKNVSEDLKEMKTKGYSVIVTRPEKGSATLPSVPSKYCVVMGNESAGTTGAVDQTADIFYSIPQYGDAESLNVAVSFGILLHDLKK